MEFLSDCARDIAFALPPERAVILSELLSEAAFEGENYQNRKQILLHYAKAALHLLQTQKLTPLAPLSGVRANKKTDTAILKAVSYINEKYSSKITLETLSKKFFISVNTLCKRFQDSMNCSVIEYTTFVRLNKAKMYLLTTQKGMEEIAGLCGFSSANYFGLIFKKHFGCSPVNYRKIK